MESLVPRSALSPSTKSPHSSLTARYVIALAVVAVLACTSYLLLGSQIQSQEATGAVINVAGKQRMLSQRAPRLLLEVLAAPDEASAEERRAELEGTLATMLKDHRGLVRGDLERGLPGEYPDDVAAMYHGDGRLDQRVEAFVSTLQKLSRMSKSELVEAPEFFAALDASRAALLGDLNKVVGMYEENSETSVAKLKSTQSALLAAMLLTLLGIGFVLFRPMVRKICDQVDQLRARERDMSLVLGNTKDGLLLVDATGALLETKSEAALSWFGDPRPGATVWDYLFDGQADRRAMLAMGWEELSEGFLPIEVTLGQMPERLERAGRTYALGYTPLLGEDEEITHVLVAASDITDQLALQELERRGREVQNFVRFMVRDRCGAEAFVEETGRLLESLESSDEALLLRALHTIKGNTAVYGLDSLAGLAHEQEDRVVEEFRDDMASDVRCVLQAEWDLFLAEIEVFLAGAVAGVQLLEDEYESFLDDVSVLGDEKLTESVRSWRSPRLQFSFQRLERQAHRLAEQLGRDVEVLVQDNGVRTDAQELQGFWSALVHVLRNALDHGIETPEERVDLGKARTGRIQLGSVMRGDELIVDVTDDGRGIDWDRVREKAASMGLSAATHDELTAAVLHDGLSTRDEVSSISGRGVGMAVLQGEVQRRNGRIELKSEEGKGTRWRFRFPTVKSAVERVAA